MRLVLLKLKLKYHLFNYKRFLHWGVQSPYYKSKINNIKKEISKEEKKYRFY